MIEHDCNTCPVNEDMQHLRAACLACRHGEPPPEARRQVTPLPRPVEERLIQAVNSIAGMDNLDILLALHTLRGGDLSNFGSFCLGVSRQIARYGKKGPSRHVAFHRFAKMSAKFPAVAALKNWVKRGTDGGRPAGSGHARGNGLVGSSSPKVEKPCWAK